MKPKAQDATAFELFQARFDQILNPQHALVRLADAIDWPRFDAAFADSYREDLGAPGKAIRLMVGLHYLKYAFDESVVDRCVENPYWQYFCGFTHMQHEAPIDHSSMSDSKKLYSWHEPEVKCISKGKAHKRYEFGQKVALAGTQRGDWFVAARLMRENPYDGHTLDATLAAAESVMTVSVTDAYVDRGYRGHGYDNATRVHIAGSRLKNASRAERKRRRRRSAIEPKIGHLNSDNRVLRCYLSGLQGDAINIVLAAAAANLRKLLKWLSFARLATPWARLMLRWTRLLRWAKGRVELAALSSRKFNQKTPPNIWPAAAWRLFQGRLINA